MVALIPEQIRPALGADDVVSAGSEHG